MATSFNTFTCKDSAPEGQSDPRPSDKKSPLHTQEASAMKVGLCSHQYGFNADAAELRRSHPHRAARVCPARGPQCR